MHDFLSTLSLVLPIIAAGYVLLILLVGFYLKIRRQFSIKVNCWFCNSWFKVPYDHRNNFQCPQCDQYNGFTDDGDYNRNIPEQHDELLNKSQRLINNKPRSNGLCNICNNNQVLKVVQLARFVPMNEDNYDAEIEHFQTQLEKAYKLCKKCEKVLKNTLDTQNANIFGNHLKDMHNKTMSYLKQSNIGRISYLWWQFYQILQFSATFTVLAQTVLMNDLIIKDVSNDYIFMLTDFVKSLQFVQIWSFRVDSHILLYSFCLLLQIIPTSRSRSFTQINRLLCWSVLVLITVTKLQKYSIYLETPLTGYLLFTSFIRESKPLKIITKSKKITNPHTSLYGDCSDDEIEDVSLASTKSSSIEYLGASSTPKDPLNTNCEPLINTDLNKSLNNLHLGGGLPTIKPVDRLFSPLQRPKPVLSPPKLTNLENHLLDNSFWRNSYFLSPTQQQLPLQQQRTDLSRSSSQSSGIGSQSNDYNNYQYLNKNNSFGDHLERASVISEPAYYFKPLSSLSPPPPPLPQGRTFLRQEGTIFFPNLQQNHMLWIHGGSFSRVTTPDLHHERSTNWFERVNNEPLQGFRDLSLRSDCERNMRLYQTNPVL